MDELLANLGFPHLKFDMLTKAEQETFYKKLGVLQQGKLTIEKEKEFITAMKNAVEERVTTPGVSEEERVHLLARLKNLMLIEAFLETPERAKRELQRSLENIK